MVQQLCRNQESINLFTSKKQNKTKQKKERKKDRKKKTSENMTSLSREYK